MTIGHRLKEERQRLGLSQTDFSALAGASKGAQLKWEKDDAFPNAQALAAFAEAGADVLFILTGRRQDRDSDTGSAAELQPLASQLKEGYDLASLEAEIIRLKTNTGHNGYTKALLAIYRDYLTGIATKDYYPESAKPAADSLLIDYFDDADAAERSATRFSKIVDSQKAIRREIDAYIAEHQLDLPAVLYQALITIVSAYRVDGARLAPLLDGLRRMQSGEK